MAEQADGTDQQETCPECYQLLEDGECTNSLCPECPDFKGWDDLDEDDDDEDDE